MTLPTDADLVTSSQENRESGSQLQGETSDEQKPEEPILCPHCLRTASNGIKCKGLCVADSDY